MKLEYNKLEVHHSTADMIVVADAKYRHLQSYFRKLKQQDLKTYNRIVNSYHINYANVLAGQNISHSHLNLMFPSLTILK